MQEHKIYTIWTFMTVLHFFWVYLFYMVTVLHAHIFILYFPPVIHICLYTRFCSQHGVENTCLHIIFYTIYTGISFLACTIELHTQIQRKCH